MDNFSKTFEQNMVDCSTELKKQELDLRARTGVYFQVLNYLSALDPDYELLGFDLFGSMLTVRFKRFSARILEDLQEIVGGEIKADPDDSGKWEIGKVGILWLNMEFYPELLEDKQIPFKFEGEEK